MYWYSFDYFALWYLLRPAVSTRVEVKSQRNSGETLRIKQNAKRSKTHNAEQSSTEEQK